MGIYRGWYMVAIAMVIYMIIVGATFGSFGLFIRPVSQEFGLSRADANTALILLNIGSLFAAPLIGRMLDFSSIKWIMRACSLLLGLSFVALGLSHSLWLDAAVLLVAMSSASLGAGTLTATVLVARWFVVRRGRALVLTAMGLSLGNITIPTLVGWFMGDLGWRVVLILMGAAATPVLLILSLLIVDRPNEVERAVECRPAPDRAEADPVAAADIGEPAKAGAILLSGQFWLICLPCAVGTAVAQALTVTLLPLAQESGYSMFQVTSLMSVMGSAAILFKLGLALFADRIDRVIMLTVLLCVEALLNAMLLHSERYVVLLTCAALIGVSSAAISPIMQALQADRLGLASFGTVRGLSTPISAGVSALLVRLSGEIYDRTGSYTTMFLVFGAMQLLAAVMMISVRYRGAASWRYRPFR
jgi:MFS family permease